MLALAHKEKSFLDTARGRSIIRQGESPRETKFTGHLELKATRSVRTKFLLSKLLVLEFCSDSPSSLIGTEFLSTVCSIGNVYHHFTVNV